jgi:hypothetical protein
MSREDVRTIVTVAPEVPPRDTWPAPDMRLVKDDRPAPAVLNDNALPAGWEKWISDWVQAPQHPRQAIHAEAPI